MIRVTVWNEYVHEREYEGIAKVYPKGIHGCIADFLGVEDDITVTCATLDMENQGISEELLKNTDVLIWWSHARQEDITDENVKLIQNNVLQGMGFIGLHSAHFSKPMKALLGTCLHEFGHFFVGKLHFAGKDFLLDAGREVVCDVDASCIVAGAENGGTADTVFLCDPVTGFLSRVVVITVITTTFLC